MTKPGSKFIPKPRATPVIGGVAGAHRHNHEPPPQGSVRYFTVGEQTDDVRAMREEIEEMKDVLEGRSPAPISKGIHTLQEVANAYYSRVAEMTMAIQALETDKRVHRGDVLYKFRTGELRTFLDICNKAQELGSRRLTYASLLIEAERTGIVRDPHAS